ncbi:hypothetical protein Nepgr_023733 [Nepenthes gracilis]|uniref:Gag-pol polyprotein n=1 Tax=Nepenthes gracilis TaxID=150966 RepID=A0AAD3T1Y1_NEPGR|nr:hypothetical protein Nepgr_023733 [Nepenthes gracilis]
MTQKKGSWSGLEKEETIEDIGKEKKSQPNTFRTDRVDVDAVRQIPLESNVGGSRVAGNHDEALPAPQEDKVQDLAPQQVEVAPGRRSSRERRPSVRLPANEYILLTDAEKPEDFGKAMCSAQNDKWFEAMKEEMTSLHENYTFELAKLPKGKKALKNKWLSG